MKRYFIKIKLYSCIGLLIVSVLVPLKVLAVDYGFYSANDIMFYDPNAPSATELYDPSDPNSTNISNDGGEEIGMECYKIIGVGEPGNKDVLSRIVSFYRSKQLAFSWVEMTSKTYKWSIDEMENQDVDEAVRTFVDHYEVPSPEEIASSIVA